MTPTPDPLREADAKRVLAEAWHRYLAATAPGAFAAEQLLDDAGGILAALDDLGFTIVAQPAPALDVTGLREALLHQAADDNLSESFRKGIKFAAGYMDSWTAAPDDDPVKRRFRAAALGDPA